VPDWHARRVIGEPHRAVTSLLVALWDAVSVLVGQDGSRHAGVYIDVRNTRDWHLVGDDLVCLVMVVTLAAGVRLNRPGPWLDGRSFLAHPMSALWQ